MLITGTKKYPEPIKDINFINDNKYGLVLLCIISNKDSSNNIPSDEFLTAKPIDTNIIKHIIVKSSLNLFFFISYLHSKLYFTTKKIASSAIFLFP